MSGIFIDSGLLLRQEAYIASLGTHDRNWIVREVCTRLLYLFTSTLCGAIDSTTQAISAAYALGRIGLGRTVGKISLPKVGKLEKRLVADLTLTKVQSWTLKSATSAFAAVAIPLAGAVHLSCGQTLIQELGLKPRTQLMGMMIRVKQVVKSYGPVVVLGSLTVVAVGLAYMAFQRYFLASWLHAEIPTSNPGVMRSVWKSIVAFKQWEIKNFALMTFFAPKVFAKSAELVPELKANIAANGHVSTFKTYANDAYKDFQKRCADPVYQSKAGFVALSIGAALLTTPFERRLGLRTDNFDASGHFRLKTTLGIAAPVSLDLAPTFSTDKGKKVAQTLLAINYLTDAMLLAETAMYHHTPAEVLAGTAAGLGTSLLVHGMTRWRLREVLPPPVPLPDGFV